MKYPRLLAGLSATLIALAQPVFADDHQPSVRLEIAGLKLFHAATAGVTYVAGGRHYWVPDGYREHRFCDDRRHDRHRHVHFYYDQDSADYHQDWDDDEDSDEDSDSDRKRYRHRDHRHPHHHHRGYEPRGVNGRLIITVPLF